MTSHGTTKAKAAVSLEPAHTLEDWTVVDLQSASDALPIRKQVHTDDTFEFVTPPTTAKHMSRVAAAYPERWFGVKEEQSVDCFSVCTDSKMLGRPNINLLEEIFVSFL